MAANVHLQKCYINSRYSPTVDEWPPYQPRHYTTLALIHHKDKCTDATVISITQELAVAGKIQLKLEGSSPGNSKSQTPNIYSNTTKNISDVFASVTASDGLTINPCIILIEGAPGIGKTVLAKEIAFQWANNKLLRDKKVLLLLFLRECNFNNIKSVENLVEHVVGSSKMTASLTEHLLQTEGKDLAIVFDGYDEISEENRKNSIIARIIYRRIFGKCCLVVTSRPTASSNLHNIVDCRVEIVGFTEENRLDYIQTALQGNDGKGKALILYLQSNPTINALCYIPLNMTILLCLVEDGIDKLPKTQTSMYKQFIKMTIVRFIQKSDTKCCVVIDDIGNLPSPYNEVFNELVQLAYSGLKVDKIIFTLNEIKNICPNLTMSLTNWNGLGLLRAVQYFDHVTFHFLHFSIQEYMAAWYISTLSDNKQIKLLKETFWQYRYYNTWIMYIGITCGSSFALKHFLSGNWFQIYTRIFKTSSISKRLLENKIKCLHLFQCLVESNNEDMITSVSKFFQDNQIDLSTQTLLPGDVNTLGFFLMRSINKQWEMLNLSGCNIGSTGINILCDRFLNNERCSILAIKTVDFSNNQCNFSSLEQLFNLVKSWHASQLIIKDSEILQNHANSDVYKAIEDAFILSEYNSSVSLNLGSFLFGHKINLFTIPLNTVSIRNIYLINCTMTSTTPEESVLELLPRQNLSEIHLINTPLPNQLMKRLCSDLLSTKTNLFVYNPELSDQDADEICDLISSEMTNGIMLIISNSKIQGIINTSTISERLTRLEIFNLAVNINEKCSDHMQTSPWKGILCYDSNNDDLINNTFIELLHKISYNKWSWQLSIMLIEKDVLIAHKVNYECISEKTRIYQSLKAIYLSDCNIQSKEYQILFNTKTTLIKVCIFNSHISQNCLNMLLFLCKEIFIHTLCDINIDTLSCKKNNSAVVIAKNTIFGCNPTTKQIALAHQLEPSINVFKLVHCQRQIIAVLNTTQNSLTKLHFMNCNITDQVIQYLTSIITHNVQLQCFSITNGNLCTANATKILKALQTISSLKELTLTSNNINVEAANDIAAVVSHNSKLQKFNLDDNNLQTMGIKIIAKSLQNISTLTNLNVSKNNVTKEASEDIAATLFCNSQLRELNISENKFQTTGAITITKALQSNFILKKLCISNNNITEEAADYITAAIYSSTQLQEFDISKNHLESTGAIKIAKAFQNISTLRKLYISSNHITDKAAVDIAAAIYYNTQLQEFDVSMNYLQSAGTIMIAKALQNISTLTKFYINNNNITNEAADDIAAALSCNTQLQELNINKNQLDIIKIAKGLENISTFRKLYISDSNITDEAANDIAAVIYSNTQLQEFDVSRNYLQSTGAIKIAKALQNISTLTKLYINNNYITDEAADDIAVVISCNPQLQQLDIGENNFQTTGTIVITKALQSSGFNLKKLCISNNNIAEAAADDIAAFINSNTQIQEFNVSKNNLQSMGAIKIAKALQNISTLTKFYINNNHIGDEAADDIAVALSCNAQLQELDISKNRFQTTGTITITKALQSNFILKKLCINNNKNFTDEAADDIAAVINSNDQLQEFNFSKNYFKLTSGIKIAKVLQNISTLTKLNISSTFGYLHGAADDIADHIAVALSCNTLLQELDISNNWIRPVGFIRITKALQSIATLKKLYMSSINITDKGADDISAALSSIVQLQELDISKNALQTNGIKTIAKVLRDAFTITKLYVSGNNISDEAADNIAAVIHSNTQLQEFDVSKNTFQVLGTITITTALQSVSTLTKLYINDNNITSESADDVAAVLCCNTQLQEFDISNNKLQATGVVTIAKALQRIVTLKKIFISNNIYVDKSSNACTEVVLCDIENTKAAYSIAEAVSCNATLQEFDFSENDFPVIGSLKIVQALQGTFTINKLYVSNNNITKEAADDIATALSFNTQLQEFNISRNKLGTQGIIKIAKTLQGIFTLKKFYISDNSIGDGAADDIAAALSHSCQLEVFDISKNYVGASGMIKIARALQQISTLQILHISNNFVTAEASHDIAAVCSHNTQLHELYIHLNLFTITEIVELKDNCNRLLNRIIYIRYI